MPYGLWPFIKTYCGYFALRGKPTRSLLEQKQNGGESEAFKMALRYFQMVLRDFKELWVAKGARMA